MDGPACAPAHQARHRREDRIVATKLFVGNISWDASDEDLSKLFAAHGEVTSARIVTDKFSGKSRGFGFVEMGTDEEAKAAIDALDGTDFLGRDIAVNVARPKEAYAPKSASRNTENSVFFACFA